MEILGDKISWSGGDKKVVIIDFEHGSHSDELSANKIRAENNEIETMLMELQQEKPERKLTVKKE